MSTKASCVSWGPKVRQAFKFTFITWLLVWEQGNDVFIRRNFTCVCTNCTPSSLFLRCVADHNKNVCCTQSCSKSRIRILTPTVSPGHLPVRSFIIICLHLQPSSTPCSIALSYWPRWNKNHRFCYLNRFIWRNIQFWWGKKSRSSNILPSFSNYLKLFLRHLRATWGNRGWGGRPKSPLPEWLQLKEQLL